MLVDDPLVSVVVPVYNVAPWLPRCLASISEQTYDNIEVILVDDGSTDESPALCDRYAASHAESSVIHKANGGLSDARNAGIDRAAGDWLFLLDADDYIHPMCIETMLRLALENGADIVECQFLTPGESERASWPPICGVSEVLEGREALRRVLDYDGVWIMAWNKLYRASLFEGVYYPVGKLNEDEFTTPYLYESACRAVVTRDVLYAYVQRKTSIMHTGFRAGNLDILEAHEGRFMHFHEACGGEFDAILAYHFLCACQQIRLRFKRDLSEEQSEVVRAKVGLCDAMFCRAGATLKLRTKYAAVRYMPSLAQRFRRPVA